MAYLPLRSVQVTEAAERVYDSWLADLEARLAAPDADWYRLTRDVLFELWYPGLGDYEALLRDPKTPLATRAALVVGNGMYCPVLSQPSGPPLAIARSAQPVYVASGTPTSGRRTPAMSLPSASVVGT